MHRKTIQKEASKNVYIKQRNFREISYFKNKVQFFKVTSIYKKVGSD